MTHYGFQPRARRRLSTLALVLGLAMSIVSLQALLWYFIGGRPLSIAYSSYGVDILSGGLWLVLTGISRWHRPSDDAVRQLAGVVLVLSCFTLSVFQAINVEVPRAAWPAVTIAVYPLLVPATPRSTAVVTGLAACMVPFGMWIAGLFEPLHRGVLDYIVAAITPGCAALIAYVASDVIYGPAIELEQIREQRALLAAIVEGTGDILVLRRADGTLLFASDFATKVLDAQTAFQSLRAAMDNPHEGIVVEAYEGRLESFLVGQHRVTLDAQPHTLTVARRATEHLEREEVKSLRKVARILSHELNNGLAPISSFVFSMQKMVGLPQHQTRLETALDSLHRRIQHLTAFVAGYAEFARLPMPRLQNLQWTDIIGPLADVSQFELQGALPTGILAVDPAQIEQVLINLLRNAAEAGGDVKQITLAIEQNEQGSQLRISDRGEGIGAAALENALLPFWSTKAEGTGLGLAVCRDIVVAHKGWIALSQRKGGGTIVRVWLPLASTD